MKKFFKSIFFGYFSYSTVKEVQTHCFLIAFLYRSLQISIFFYIIGYDLIKNKSYQSFETVSSTITAKVKGIGYANSSINYYLVNDNNVVYMQNNSYRIFDSADYVNPPNDYNSVFVMTNFLETKQTQGICLEDLTKINLYCKTGDDCLKMMHLGNQLSGIATGKCINLTMNQTYIGLCELKAWCPVEVETNTSENLIKNINNFTIFIKNDIQFKRFNVKKSNLFSNITSNYYSSCNYDLINDPYCPIFKIKEILTKAEPDIKERSTMFLKGGVLQIEITWDCNLDHSIENCKPSYSFHRFDLPFGSISAASGFNFRYANKFELDGKIFRNLVKAYGLRIFIVVTGKAGKFDFIPLFLSIGSGIGLLAIPSLISDFILLNLTHRTKFFRNLKEFDYKKRNCLKNETQKSKIFFVGEKEDINI